MPPMIELTTPSRMGRKVRQFTLAPMFLDEFKGEQPKWGPVGYFTYKRCVDVSTPVLCADLQWRPAGDLEVGQGIIGFDSMPSAGQALYLLYGDVLHNKVEKADTLGIELDDGTLLYATPDHSWLVMTEGRLHWRETRDMIKIHEGGVHLLRPFGSMLGDVSTHPNLKGISTSGKSRVVVTSEDYVKVIRVFDAGERDIAVLSTSTETHFTGGFASHNTYARATCECNDPHTCGHPTEEFWQTCQRVVEGVYNVQKIHCRRLSLPWNEPKAQRSAQDMYRRMWDFKFTPPGRGLSQMGASYMFEKGGAALNSCAFVSTEHLSDDFSGPFTFLMDMSMLGVGVGADTLGANTIKIQQPRVASSWKVPDDREGWVDIIRVVLNSFIGKGSCPETIDFSGVRSKGQRIRGFGGTASGPGPLVKLIKNLITLLMPGGVKVSFEEDFCDAEPKKVSSLQIFSVGTAPAYRITSTIIVDIFNMIGACVVAGGVRRTAELMIGDREDDEFRALKDPTDLIALDEQMAALQARGASDLEIQNLQVKIDAHPLRSHRWTSNNSIFGDVGMDYTEIGESIAKNGEPGILWLDNMRKYGRMIDPVDNKDRRAKGANPCFAGETLIAVADGRGAVPIKQLVEEGNDVPVYSMDPKTGMIEIKMARNPRLTRELSPLVEIELDDGSTFRVTPDHKMYLLDGTTCPAQDLQPGDSLPRFQKRLEVAEEGGREYIQVATNTRDVMARGSRVFEHRILAKFHGSVDNRGEKNPMWGRVHSDESKAKIGLRTTERCQDPAFRAKLSTAHTAAEREASSRRMSSRKKTELLAYYKEQEAKTDLDTVWMGGRLYAIRSCETCADDFIVAWRVRGQSYCSCACMNKHESHIKDRVIGQEVAFINKQRQTLHKQVDAYKVLEAALGRTPIRKEWETACRDEGTPFRFRKAGTIDNPHALTGFGHLKEVAANYNHRVKSIRHLDVEAPVYNLSVDDHHTVALVTSGDGKTQCSGLLTAQCAEQTLESYECCTLVETYPAHHETYEDFQRTLKSAYLYAKTVTLVPTHDPRTNAVMNRNRRIGCSMSGIRQAIERTGRREFLNWCDRGYSYIGQLDTIYSEWLGIPRSIKTTSVKPSGCRPWDALTSTDRGLLTLEDLFDGHPMNQEWADLQGDVRALGSGMITRTYNNGVSPVLKVTTSYNIEVESTPRHQWWVVSHHKRGLRNSRPEVQEWRRAEDLQVNDILEIQPGVYTVERSAPLASMDSLAVRMRGDAVEIHQPSHMSPRLAWMLGYMWGDGAMSPAQYRLRWVDGIRENLLKVKSILAVEFGLDANVNFDLPDRDAGSLEIGSKILWHWLIRNGIFKMYSKDIHIIPRVVRESSQEDIVAFLAGLMDADGCTSKAANDSVMIWTTANANFARHVQNVLLAIGIVTGRSHQTQGGSFQKRKSMWHLTSSVHVDERAIKMLRRHSVKMQNHEAREGFKGWRGKDGDQRGLILGKVLKVEPVGEMPTFDVEVADTHWYYAGAIKSHNTVSLLCGATPGIHLPHSPFYIRNIRVNEHSPLRQIAMDAGYKVEKDVCADATYVISFPVKVENCGKGKRDVSIWEQVALASDVQRYWADNQVSCLVGDTLIHTSVGIIPMAHLPLEMGIIDQQGVHPYQGPLQVLNADNGWSPITALIINPELPIVCLSMEGGRSLTGTPDHEVRVMGDDLNYHWRPMGDLKAGDSIVEVISQTPRPSGMPLPRWHMEPTTRSDTTLRCVLGVKDAGVAITYDVTVSDSHSYIANGFASHNCTVTFRPDEASEISTVLEAFEDRLKAISFLPLREDSGYLQPPYSEISEEEYLTMVASITPMDLTGTKQDVEDKFCTTDVCELKAFDLKD